MKYRAVELWAAGDVNNWGIERIAHRTPTVLFPFRGSKLEAKAEAGRLNALHVDGKALVPSALLPGKRAGISRLMTRAWSGRGLSHHGALAIVPSRRWSLRPAVWA